MRPILLVLALAGCGVGLTGADETADPADAYSPAGQAVIAALREAHGADRGRTWELADSALAPGWLVETPVRAYVADASAPLPVAASCAGAPGCDADFDLMACATQADCTFGGTCTPVRATVAAPGQQARSLCAGHSDAVVDRVYDLVTSAQAEVDISSLTPPDGRFEAALRNAFALLAAEGRDVHVRYLYGAIPGASLAGAVPEPAEVQARLSRDAGALSITVAEMRASLDTWDHAKVIAIDRTTALVGGHNLLTRHYLQAAPVYDLSMIVSGSAAADAATFTDALWHYVCGGGQTLGSVATIAGDCEAAERPVGAIAATAGGTRMIGVGRLGELGDSSSDDALVALIDAAETRLRISQQDLGGLAHDWPQPVVDALARAAQRGVLVQLVMSNVDAYPDNLTGGSASYSNGWTPADVVGVLRAAGAPCAQLQVAALRRGGADHWPDGAGFANHAKLVIADDGTFYLGSQNLYPSNLAEYGYIVDDAAATAEVADYFAAVWSGSQRTLAACD